MANKVLGGRPEVLDTEMETVRRCFAYDSHASMGCTNSDVCHETSMFLEIREQLSYNISIDL